jgi:hypothetical protein
MVTKRFSTGWNVFQWMRRCSRWRWRQLRPPQAEGGPKLRITCSVYEDIKRTIGNRPAEQGGVLGGSRGDGVVTHFYFDESARQTGTTYSPNDQLLNRLFAEGWNPKGNQPARKPFIGCATPTICVTWMLAASSPLGPEGRQRSARTSPMQV